MSMLVDKTAIVTGGARGIGKAIVEAFANAGAYIAVLDKEFGSTSLDLDVDQLNGSVRMFECDVADEEAVRTTISRCADGWENINVLVNNAAVQGESTPAEASVQEWDHVIGVNLRGAWLMAKYVLPRMTSGSVIINVSSVLANRARAARFPYSESKAALLALTRSLAVEYGGRGIRSVAVSPGFIRTRVTEQMLASVDRPDELERRLSNQQPLRRIGHASEVAKVVAFLASDDASFVTGTGVAVDGGLTAWLGDLPIEDNV